MEDKKLNKKLKEDIHKLKEQISEEGIQSNNNLEYLYKLVDIEKDLCEIEKGGESMNYNGYGRYGRDEYGMEGHNLGNYGRDEYGRRGNYRARGNYRGNDYMDSMYNEYNRYEEGREQYNRGGNYNAKEDSMKSLEYMLESMVDFVKMLKEEAQSQEEVNMIKKYTRKISEM